MSLPQEININDFIYDLPDDQVPAFPLLKRDGSRLLFYRKGEISHHAFPELSVLLPERTLLIFNQTRVIYARLLARRSTGAAIEVLVMEPLLPFSDMQQALSVQETCVWKCMTGNKKKWREGETLMLQDDALMLEMEWHNRERDEIRFRWNQPVHFAEVLRIIGNIPIPPYLNREADENDKTVYQTVYSRDEGSIAAPTAGLHFTPEVIAALEKNKIQSGYITLHVGAGTFKPVKEQNALLHEMHREEMVFSRETIAALAAHEGAIIPVGTTSARSLESLYWYGHGLLSGELSGFDIPQYFPYAHEQHRLPGTRESLEAVLARMQKDGMELLHGTTSIFIVPGYRFRVCSGLVTNFHQPGSTLLLLIAALIGSNWKKVYSEAARNRYRFLSFGDSSLLLP